MPEPTVENRKIFQVDSLNGLWGLAAIIVVLSHASVAGYSPPPDVDFSGNGKAGVYLFFLLSSFLLSRPFFHRGLSSYSQVNLSKYWKRRISRVYPLYFFYIVGFGLATFAVTRYTSGNLGAFEFSLIDVTRQLLLLEGRGVTWTIIVEFKFYLLLPLVTYVVYRLENAGLRRFVPLLFPHCDHRMSRCSATQRVTEQSYTDFRLLIYLFSLGYS
jgi:peptidoglycan/LPS O-acetylase OafA/YrhL